MSKKEEIKGKVIIEDTGPISAEDLARSIYGLSLEELAQKIRRNEDGRYDRLFKKEG